MTDQGKDRPEPLEAADHLRSALTRAASGDVDENLSIRMRVSGGMPSQAYRFDFRASGTLQAQCELDNDLTSQHLRSRDTRLETGQLSALSRKMVDSGVLDVGPEPPRFLPDTVVGVIEVSDGHDTFKVYFAADPDQAAVQDKVPPPEVRKAADAIFALGAGLVDEEKTSLW